MGLEEHRCAIRISVHRQNAEIHLRKYIYSTAPFSSYRLFHNELPWSGQVRSLYHPCRIDECSSKLSVQCLFEKSTNWWLHYLMKLQPQAVVCDLRNRKP